MTWITGTATNYKNLLSLLEGHLTDEGWTTNDYDTGGAAPNTDTLYVRAPGFGTGYENYCAIRTYEDSAQSHYCFELRGATAYDAGQPFESQPGVMSNSVIMRLWNASIDYWLSVSDRRFVLVAKCSNTYHSMYAGFFNAFASPTEYPYPFYAASDADVVGPFGATETDTRSIAFPGEGAAFMREPGGQWRHVAVYQDSATYDFQPTSASRYTIYPYSTPSTDTGSSASDYYGPSARFESLPSVSDSMFAMNTYIFGMNDDAGVVGTLEGVYWIPGNSVSAEQTLTIVSDDYTVFIAISRSTEAPNQFYCIKEA